VPTDILDYFRSPALARDIAILLTKNRSVVGGVRAGKAGRWRFVESTASTAGILRAHYRWGGRHFVVLDSGAAIAAVRLRTGSLCASSTELGERYLREVYRKPAALGAVGDARYWVSPRAELAQTVATCLRSILRILLLDISHE
jgi:hypothetical protein